MEYLLRAGNGAIIAQVGFSRLKDIGGPNNFVKHILETFALFMLAGIFSTLLIPETKNKTLEELSNEEQEGFVRVKSLLTLGPLFLVTAS